MEFTKLERIQLINQFKILKVIKPDDREYYEEWIEILTNGYTIYYSDLGNWVEDEMPVDECSFVVDILDLYRAIENYKSHHEAKAINEHALGNFPGFDGNYEGHYFIFTRFLLDKQKKFQEQAQYRDKTDDFNSHWPTLDQYKKMVAKWEKLGRKHEMSEAEILEILKS